MDTVIVPYFPTNYSCNNYIHEQTDIYGSKKINLLNLDGKRKRF